MFKYYKNSSINHLEEFIIRKKSVYACGSIEHDESRFDFLMTVCTAG